MSASGNSFQGQKWPCYWTGGQGEARSSEKPHQTYVVAGEDQLATGTSEIVSMTIWSRKKNSTSHHAPEVIRSRHDVAAAAAVGISPWSLMEHHNM